MTEGNAAGTTTRRWTRWQDWVVVLLGLYAALAPIWTDTNDNAMWTLIVLGALLALTGLWSLAMPTSTPSEWVHLGLGVLLFIAPWVMDYADLTAAAWTSWIVGALAVIVGAYGAQVVTSGHHRAVGQH